MIGTITSYSPRKGVGVIHDTYGYKYYFYQNGFKKGQRVEFKENEGDDEVAQIVKVLQPQRWFQIKRYTFLDNLISVLIALILGAIMAFFLVKNVHAETLFETMDTEDIHLLAQLAHAEGHNQDVDGMRYIVAVVLNRLDSSIFPNTISEIIFQPGQFAVVGNGEFEKSIPEESDFEAVKQELEHRSNKEILYFTAGNYGEFGTPSFKYKEHYFSK